MKFGKQLRLAAAEAWIDYYVDYKEAKKLLKRKINEAVEALDAAAAEAGSGSATGAKPQDPVQLAAQIRKVLATCVQKEFVKYDNFINRQLVSIDRAASALDSSNSNAVTLVRTRGQHSFADLARHSPALPAVAGAGAALEVTADDATVAKLKLLDENKVPVPAVAPSSDANNSNNGGGDAAATATAADPTSESARASAPPATGTGDDSDADSDVDTAAAHAAALARLLRRLTSLARFVQLNCTGIVKLCKKVDKKLAALRAHGHPQAAGDGGSSSSSFSDQFVPAAERKRTLREAQIEALRDQLAARLGELPPVPMVQEGEMQKEESNEFGQDSDVLSVDKLELKKLPVAAVTNLSLAISTNGLGEAIRVPVIVAKGARAGPVVGITCAIHGNELNGIPIIFRVMRELDLDEMCGTLVAAPVLNTPGFLRHQREFSDGQDLNRLFPGSATGNAGKQYVHLLHRKLLRHFEYVLDLHTASFGRINSLYVRADMNNPIVKKMALLQNPQIIVHNSAMGGSIRGWCGSKGVPCITVEVGNPSTFHRDFIKTAFVGVENILAHLKITSGSVVLPDTDPVICNASSWSFATHGGILRVLPELCDWVSKGQVIAQVRNVYGAITHVYRSEREGVVVGKNTNPVCQRGDRLLHLGYVNDSSYAKNVQDGH